MDDEKRILHQIIESQAKQIGNLTEQVAALSAAVKQALSGNALVLAEQWR